MLSYIPCQMSLLKVTSLLHLRILPERRLVLVDDEISQGRSTCSSPRIVRCCRKMSSRAFYEKGKVFSCMRYLRREETRSSTCESINSYETTDSPTGSPLYYVVFSGFVVSTAFPSRDRLLQIEYTKTMMRKPFR